MSKRLRMNNDELRMALALILVAVCLACVVLFVKRYDWDTVPRVSNVDLKAHMSETKVQFVEHVHDGCTYIKVVRGPIMHKANCPNPIHNKEGK